MSVELVFGVQKLQVLRETDMQSDMLHNPQILPNRQRAGLLYAMQIGSNRDFYIKTVDEDLPIATVFPSRFPDYHQELTQAAINGGFHIAEKIDCELYLPRDLFAYITGIEIIETFEKLEIFSMNDARSVIDSYKIPLNTD
jgi:hypothetical protein